MTSPDPGPTEAERVDAEALINDEAADIDARSPDAPEQIAELIDDADDLGLATPEPPDVDPPAPAES